MTQLSSPREILVQTQRWFQHVPGYFAQPINLARQYKFSNLQADFVASLTVAIVLLPQAIAYALIAELPPSTGLYAAIVAAIVGGLWGSSFHLHTGPTNTTSLLVLSGLLAVAVPNTDQYLLAAGVMAVWAGVIRLIMGIARLGILVNFVSDSVVVGFTAGAGILIVAQQLRHLMQVPGISTPNFYLTVLNVFQQVPNIHFVSLEIGIVTVIGLLAMKRFTPKLPGPLIVMILASVAVWLFGLHEAERSVSVLGDLPRGFPPLTSLPLFDIELLQNMMPGIIAVALIGLIEAASISRAIASRSGQYLNSDQEFIGQGMANIAAGFFSGYPVAGSLTRSAVNYEAGASTQLSAILSAVWALLAMLVFAPAAAFIPRPALAGVIVVTGSRMVNINGIRQIWRTSTGDAAVMAISFITPLIMPLEYAVLTGILVSFAHFIFTTATPTVTELLPEDDFRHLSHQPDRPGCPQLSILSIMGSLYFGAAPYVEDAIRTHQKEYPERKFLILRFNRVNHMDISGIHMLETIVKLYRDNGGDIFLVGVREKIRDRLTASGVGNYLGEDHFLQDENAITHVFFKILDPAICVYQCRQKVWRECQSLPKSETPFTLPPGIQVPRTVRVPSVSPQVFWKRINDNADNNIEVIDIREPAEYSQGHLRVATPVPMRQFLDKNPYIPARDKEVIFVCRNGRRSHQLAYYFQKKGYFNVFHLEGGMTALEVAALPKGR